MRNTESFRKEIAYTVKKHPEGLTIADLASMLGVHRQTVTKHILFLEGAGIIYRRRIGSATLHYFRTHYEKLRAQGVRS